MLNLHKQLITGLSKVNTGKTRQFVKMTEAIETQGSSEFSERLQEEIQRAKREQRLKRERRENGYHKPSKKLRDSSGFKLRLVESSGKNNGAKMVDPEYTVVIDGPFRRIKPYYFTYKTFCKLRWRDRNILDIFTSEFRDRKESYYKKCIEEGSVLVDGKPATLDTIVRNGNLISHKLHRHEPPVVSTPVRVVYENSDILVIDKPSGIPVHPTGRYRFNTITKILERQLGYVVHPCNRLDKLTSGLMFLAKTPKGADEMGDQLKVREVRKQYIARVVGEFPDDEVVVEKPVRTFDPRVSLNVVSDVNDDGAKHAKTIFEKISFDGKTSIIKCIPLTGRQHQIRVHLQYLGHPIANDPIYSSPQIWGDNLGKNGEADFADVAKRLHEVGKTKFSHSWFYPDSHGELLTGETCPECGTDLFSDPDVSDLTLWLHAYRYKSTDESNKWSYQTTFPDWALDSGRKFMKLAIENAKKCRSGDSTIYPNGDGVVLVKGTQILAESYSGELRNEGDALSNAIEKYTSTTGEKKLPRGTILYSMQRPSTKTAISSITEHGIMNVFYKLSRNDVEGGQYLSGFDVEFIHFEDSREECPQSSLGVTTISSEL